MIKKPKVGHLGIIKSKKNRKNICESYRGTEEEISQKS